MNPNGIIFGQNAKLDIGGLFMGTTANSIKFSDGVEFSATNPTSIPLLTMSVPIGLQFGTNPGAIANRSIVNGIGLQVPTGRSLVLAGGEIALEGGRLRSRGGQIELASVAAAGTLGLIMNIHAAKGIIAKPEVTKTITGCKCSHSVIKEMGTNTNIQSKILSFVIIRLSSLEKLEIIFIK
jgi:hypothetical protein